MVTKENYLDFKMCYDNAVKESKEQFQFNGIDVLTSYAKYVIEYIEKHI